MQYNDEVLSSAPLLRDLILETKDGEWGAAEGGPASVEMFVIRGTDFDDVRNLDLRTVPVRHILERHAVRKALRGGDVLIETAGGSKGRPTGRTVFLRDELFGHADKPVTCASFARFMRFDRSKVEPEYVYWWLQSLYLSGRIETYQVQHSGIARFQFTKFADEVRVPLPTRETQRFIADLLGVIERRMTLLRQTNATLESMAQALFKSWFIGFDPVRSKAEGREPEGMGAETAAVFPSDFEESRLGLIPKGWTVRSLDSFANYLNGLALQKFPPESDDEFLPVIKIAQLRVGNTVGADRASSKLKPEYVVHDGDVLFSWSGSLEVEFWSGGDGALNQHLFKVTSTEVPKWFYYLATRHFLPVFRDIAAHKATTMGHIQRKHLTEARLAVPPAAVLESLSRLVAPLLERRIANSLQARQLAALRDALLPRLISGKLRIPEAVQQMDEAFA